MSFKASAKAARSSLSAFVEIFWDCGFLAAGRFTRNRARQWMSAGDERVMVVAPHPDDEAIACSGTILRHVMAGDDVVVAIATDGRRSRVAVTPEEMARLRREEAIQAARRLGVNRLEWLGLPEGDWCSSDLEPLLGELLQRQQPTVLYAPSRIDFHPEHLAVAHTLAMALDSVTVKPRVRVYQVQVPLTRLLTNLVTDVSAVVERSTTVLRAYKSQAGSIACAYRRARYSALSHRASGPIEEFWELSAEQYAGLHRGSPTEWRDGFRGLRPFAWTDPLAYLVGYGSRRRLKQATLSPS